MRVRVRLLALAPLALLLAVASAALGQGGASQPPRLTVLATDPAPPRATLGANATFYIRYQVATAKPVTVQIEAYGRGQRLSTGNSGISKIPAGGGTNVSFFFLLSRKRQAVDEVRLLVSDTGKPQRRWITAVPVALTFDPAIGGSPPPVAGWVKSWQQRRAAETKAAIRDARRADERREAEHPGAIVGLRILIGLLVLGLPLASIALPVWAIWSWTGRWRLLAGLSAGVVGLKLVSVMIGVARDPTSHNLWPLEIALWEIPALGFLVLLWLARRAALRLDGNGPGA